MRIESPSRESTTVVETIPRSHADTGAELYSSRVSVVLDSAWTRLRKIEPALPSVVMLVLSGGEYSRRGHFRMESWRKRREPQLLHEVAVHPGMFDCPEDLLVTMLHEAAHAILWEQRKDGDRHCCGVSLSGYYHRREFRAAANRLGLEVHFRNRRYGFSQTTWPATGVPEKYAAVIGILDRLKIMASKQVPPRALVQVNKRAAAQYLGCKCVPMRVLRVPHEQLRRGPIVCGTCWRFFLPGA